MCTYSQLKKNVTKLCATHPGGQWRPFCPNIVHVKVNRYLKMY